MNKKEKNQQPFSGFFQILINAGFTLALASALAETVREDERVPEMLDNQQRPLIFMTQMDSKVDDLICLPLEGTIWDEQDQARPQIPSTTHPNCRCYWLDPVTGANLGQF
jgi:hypothetical protein